MTHIRLAVLAVLAVLALTSTAAANTPTAPYADYVTYVTTYYTRTTADQVLAIANQDPTGAACFTKATSRADRDVCQRFLQEKALVDALPIIATAARAKLLVDISPEERATMLPIGQACVASADRLAETGIAPLRKIGPYTIGLLKSKLCNALLVSVVAAH